MKRVLDIRWRLILAAVLPVMLVGLLLGGVFTYGRWDELQRDHDQRLRTLARQVAAASEYGLFVGNPAQLQSVARSAMRQPDVRGLLITDAYGRMLAALGEHGGLYNLLVSREEAAGFDAELGLDWVLQPVLPAAVPLDDIYEDRPNAQTRMPIMLGQVLLYGSRQSLLDQQRRLLLLGMGVALLGLIFGIGLAYWLGNGVLRPILRVKSHIERIGRGEFQAVLEEPAVGPHDPLQALQGPLRDMASQLARTQQGLQQQVSRVTQALREKKEEAEQANRAKSRFLAAASHDLRQPVHALGLFVSRLSRLPHEDAARVLVRQVEESVQAMQNLLDELLDVSRLEAGTVRAEIRPVELAPLLRQLQRDIEPTARAQGLRLRVRPKDVWVLTDPPLLYRILLNLVGNAVRYTPRGGVLVLARGSAQGQAVRLQVCDTGVGIAPEHQKAVFGEFFQVANPARERRLGLGLGLNIVQRTAQLLGHAVSLRSQEGRGTCVTVTLPLALPSQIPPHPLRAQPQPDAGSEHWAGRRLLLVEDDSLAAQAMAGLLQDWGLQVRLAATAAQALQLVQTWRPDLVVTDYRLPDTHGLELVASLRRLLQDAALPVCLVSGDTDPVLLAQVQASGLTLLHKPVRPAKLRALLRRLLQSQRETGSLP